MPPPEPKGRNRTLWIVLGILAFLGCGCCGLFGYFGYIAVRDVMPVASCGVTAEAVREAMLAYAEENDGNLPPAATWQDDIRPYYEKIYNEFDKDQPFSLRPPDGEWGCDAGNTSTRFVFNSELAGAKIDEIKDPKDTILLFETDKAGRNLSDKYVKQPDESGPPLIFGQNRPWLALPVKGDANISFRGGKMRIEGLEKGGSSRREAQTEEPQ